MNYSEFAQLESAFERASDLPPQERTDFLKDLMAVQPDLAVRALLLLSPPDAGADHAIKALLERAEREEVTGDAQIGGCTILGVIGEGGFGIVYLAEQSAPIRRFVAIKVIKPGMDSAAVLARFDAERQALALMDHPAVVGALSAGLAHDGRPYVIMPLVPGLPITDFCREQALNLRARLDLMAEVCRGVAHAHAKGVIHRDLKPANILVAMVDGAPRPRVIDFGLAKALATPLTSHATLTLDGQLVGTPEYMSPEQAAGQPLDTRSDLYAIGAVLYELIAGRPPHTSEELRSSGADGVRRVLAEVVPRPPSAYAQQHVPREVDWIALKCLEKEHARRYSTVSSLAHDLEAVLLGSEVRAGPPAKLYRWWRWSVRHRASVTAAGLLALSLVVGSGVSLSFALRERRARQQQYEVVTFLRGMFTGLDPEVAQGRDRSLLLLTLSQAADRLRSDSWSPEVKCQLSTTLAACYQVLGESTSAQPYADEGQQLSKLLWSDADPRSIEARRVWLENQFLLNAAELSWIANESEAHTLRSTAEAVLPADSRTYFETMLTCSRFMDRDPRVAFLEQLQQRAELALGRSDRLTLRIMRELGSADHKHPDKALVVLRDARSRALAAFGPDDPAVAAGLGAESFQVGRIGDYKAMIGLLEEQIGPARRALGPNSQTVLTASYNLANGLLHEGRAEEADQYAVESVAIARHQHGPKTVWIEWALSNHMAIRLALNDVEGATVMERELEQRRDEMQKGDAHDQFAFPPETAVRIIQEFERLKMPERAAPYVERLRRHNPELLKP